MKRIVEHVIPPKLGYALIVKQGQTLRITDLEGKQRHAPVHPLPPDDDVREGDAGAQGRARHP